MKDMQEYRIELYRIKYKILRRLICRRGIGKRPNINSLSELRKICEEMEAKSLFQLRDMHRAYLY